MLAHAFLAVTAHAARPEPPQPPASGNDGGSPGKKGTRSLWTVFAPPRTYSPPPLITGENGDLLIPLTAGEARRLFCLYTRTARPPAIPRALVTLATPPPGHRPAMPLRPQNRKSHSVAVVLEDWEYRDTLSGVPQGRVALTRLE